MDPVYIRTSTAFTAANIPVVDISAPRNYDALDFTGVPTVEPLAELRALIAKAKELTTAPEFQNPDEREMFWDRVYSQIFSPHISQRICQLLKDQGTPFDWYDPDTTYEEDVKAFVKALPAV